MVAKCIIHMHITAELKAYWLHDSLLVTCRRAWGAVWGRHKLHGLILYIGEPNFLGVTYSSSPWRQVTNTDWYSGEWKHSVSRNLSCLKWAIKRWRKWRPKTRRTGICMPYWKNTEALEVVQTKKRSFYNERVSPSAILSYNLMRGWYIPIPCCFTDQLLSIV